MPSAGEIREQVAREQERRNRLAVPAFAGGFLYLLSAIIVFKTLNGGPTVGLLQGLGPALSGVANPARSPPTAEVKYISHHAFALIAGSVLAAIAIVRADAGAAAASSMPSCSAGPRPGRARPLVLSAASLRGAERRAPGD